MNLNTMLAGLVGRYGDKTAIISGEKRVSYRELDEASNRFANALAGLGVGRGDRVAILLSNRLDFLSIALGVAKLGAIAALLDPKYKLDEVESLLNDSQPVVLVSGSACLDSLAPALSQFKSIKHVIDTGSTDNGAFLSYQKLMSASSSRPVPVEPDEEDVALIGYSSGPTFHPHGIMLCHRSIVTEADISGEGFAMSERDIVPLFALPLHHAAGLTIVVLTTLIHGGTVVMIPGISIPNLLETIQNEKATVFIGVPFIFGLLVQFAEQEGLQKYDLSSLRLCAAGGDPLPVKVSLRFKEIFGQHIAQFWGLTETTAHISCQAADGSGSLGSIGKPLRGCEVKIVDERGKELPPNHIGEIMARGPMMKGYYNNSQQTAAVFKDGWLDTGDIGKIDDRGDIFITGRSKDLIILKGQNVAPTDIELQLSRHPKVAEVAAFSVPDDARGEVVGVALRLKEGQTVTEGELKRFCLDHLAAYKVPKQFFFVTSFPRAKGGKIDKKALKQQLGVRPVFPE